MTNSENLDICPFCNKTIPQGPAYFCPTCGKRLDDEYSKRYFSFDEFPNKIQYALNDKGIIEEKLLDDEVLDYTEFFPDVDETSSFEEEADNFDDDLSVVDDLVEDESVESE